MDQREDILQDMKQLKKYAQHYLQPERPVEVDPLASCRNYFNRPSAPEQQEDDGEERAQILIDALQLKKLAVDFLHPERPVITTDANACGRNYFSRSSAPEQEDESERVRILAEARHLKKFAVDYLHPERPVVTSDPYACGRNYFTRYSAPEQEDNSEERVNILSEAQHLKKLVIDYLHPERPVVTSDPYACSRNYFTRFSAPEQEDDSKERVSILAEAQQLKKLAVDYLHPERPVATSDPCACGRNYFTRSSAPEEESFEDAEERMHILEDAEHIFNCGQPIQNPYGYFVDHYYHGYDDSRDDHHSQSGHFEMDEDINLSHEPHTVSFEANREPRHPAAAGKDHGHYDLAFSPDCVMTGFAP